MPMFPAMRPEEFIAKWRDTQFGERQASHEMFGDICRLVGHPTPGEYRDREAFTLEKWVPGGFADAYLEGRFGWEFKGSDSELDAAMNQLLRYQVHLKTPPLLIVSSFRTIRIRTNFPGMETVLHEIPVAALDRTENLDKLRWAFHAPTEFRPDRSVDTVTKETADLFQAIVEDMEQRNEDPEKLARYLNQIIFCLYAEDAGLLPDGLFSQVGAGQRPQPGGLRPGRGQPVPADVRRRYVRGCPDCPLQRRPVPGFRYRGTERAPPSRGWERPLKRTGATSSLRYSGRCSSGPWTHPSAPSSGRTTPIPVTSCWWWSRW